MIARLRRYWFEIALTAIALFGVMAALYATSYAIGTDADAATYLLAARSLMSGKGLSVPSPDTSADVPLTIFPPVLPMLLGGMGLMGVDPLVGARWLNALLFGGEILIAGILVRRCTESAWTGLAAAVVFATTEDVLIYHCYLFSEPLFLLFSLAGLLVATVYAKRPSFPLLLLFMAALALATGSRYDGASLALAGAAAILFGGVRPRHWAHLGAYLAFVGAGLVFVVATLAVNHRFADRTLGYHPPGLDRINYSYRNLSTWMLPSVVPAAIRLVALIAVLLLLSRPLLKRIRARITHQPLAPWSFEEIGLVYLASYGAMLLLTQIYFDDHIWIAGRHLLAIYLVGSMIVVCQASELMQKSTRSFQIACMVIFVAVAGVGFVRVARSAFHWHRNGLGLTSRHWNESPLIARIRAIEPNSPLFSNSRATLYLLTGRIARAIPNLMSGSEPTAGLRFRQELRDERAAVVYFTEFTPYDSPARERELEAKLGLERVFVSSEGYLLFAPHSSVAKVPASIAAEK